MKIGFDLDKIFINTPPFIPDIVIEKLYKEKANGTLLYRIPSRTEQLIRQISHLTIFRPPLLHNLMFLKSLSREKHKLYLISSRFGFLKKTTARLIKKYSFDSFFESMHFNYNNEQPHLFKNTIIKTLDLDVYVDDDYHLLKYVAKKNPDVSFFWLTRQGISKQITPNLYAISDLSQILQKNRLDI